MVGLLELRAGGESKDEGDIQEEKGVAEGEDKGLFLDDPADRHDRLMRRCGTVRDAVAE